MWDILPSEIRKKIILMNLSLKLLHERKYSPVIKSINLLKKERVCRVCVRDSVFNNAPFKRKPSLKMYARMESDVGQPSSCVRIICECDEHRALDCCFSTDYSLINNGIEMNDSEIISTVKDMFENVSHVIIYSPVDEDHIRILRLIATGYQNIHTTRPVPRWRRLSV